MAGRSLFTASLAASILSLSSGAAVLKRNDYPPLPPCSYPYTPFDYVGCYVDPSSMARALDFSAGGLSQTMTVEFCTATCKSNGFRYAGLEYYGECFCGDSINGPVAASEQECSYACTGNKAQICGGSSRISLYMDPTFRKVDNTVISDYVAVGCYSESPTGRAIQYSQAVDKTTMTTESCLAVCKSKNYPLAATEYGGECYCGVVIGNGAQPADSSKCDKPCAGNPAQMCGGSSYLNLYVASDLQEAQPCAPVTPTVTMPLTTATPTLTTEITTTTPEATSTTSTGLSTTSIPSTISSTTTTTPEATSTTSTTTSTTTTTPSTTSTTTTTSSSTTTTPSTTSTTLTTSSTTTTTPSITSTTTTTSSTTTTTTPSTTSTTTTTSSSTTTTPSTTSTTLTTSPTTTTTPSDTSTTSTTYSSTTTTSSATSSTTTTASMSLTTFTTKTTATTTSSKCISTAPAPTCEYGCGKWCSKPLPEFKDKEGCGKAYSQCKLEVADCFSNAGYPESNNCYSCRSWCEGIGSYYKGWQDGKSSKGDCYSQNPPNNGPATTPGVCTPTSTSRPSTTTEVTPPTATNVCVIPSGKPGSGYEGGKCVGDIEPPVVTCNDDKDDYSKGYLFKSYTSRDTGKCPSYPKSSISKACQDACKVQYDSCIGTYAETCKSKDAGKSKDNGKSNSGKDDSKKDRKSRRDGKDDNGGNDNNGSHGDDDYNGATAKCQSQYNDCLAANKQVSYSQSRCSSYNAGWS